MHRQTESYNLLAQTETHKSPQRKLHRLAQKMQLHFDNEPYMRQLMPPGSFCSYSNNNTMITKMDQVV